jgi:hypothetical protein
MIYKNENPIILTIDKNLQSKAIMLNISVLTLKEFLGEKEEPKKVIETNNIDYKDIFNAMKPNKQGKIVVNTFIQQVKKLNPTFDYKQMGFERPRNFVESLSIFTIEGTEFMNLKSK